MGVRAWPEVTMRGALPDDERRCAEIYLIGRRSAFSWQPQERFALDDYRDLVDQAAVVVAEAMGRVVGFVAIDTSARFVRALFVDPRWQHRGIGSSLLERAVVSLRGEAALACAARNATARAFYERQGWVPQPFEGGAANPLVLYRKVARAS